MGEIGKRAKPLKMDSWLILTLFKIVLSIYFLIFRGPFLLISKRERNAENRQEEEVKNCEVLGENNSIYSLVC